MDALCFPSLRAKVLHLGELPSCWSTRLLGLTTASARATGESTSSTSEAFGELYNLKNDPYELRNGYAAANPPTELAARLQALKKCARDSCRAAEDE